MFLHIYAINWIFQELGRSQINVMFCVNYILKKLKKDGKGAIIFFFPFKGICILFEVRVPISVFGYRMLPKDWT